MRLPVIKLFACLTLLCTPLLVAVKPVYSGEHEVKIKIIPTLTLENVYKQLLASGIKHPDIVIRQVIAETNWLRCKHCSLQFNNLFGFYTKKGYMRFDDWTQSVDYYKTWQDSFYKGGDYYSFLQRIGYATATGYLTLLKQIIPPDFTELK
jgi:hypothetical protein